MGIAANFVMWHKPFVLTFIPLSHEDSTWNLDSIVLAVSKKKKFENAEYSEWPWTKVNEWPWPLINSVSFQCAGGKSSIARKPDDHTKFFKW